MRNAVAHVRVRPTHDNKQVERFEFFDKSSFEASIHIGELRVFVEKLATHLEQQYKESFIYHHLSRAAFYFPGAGSASGPSATRGPPCYNGCMDVGDIRFYKERWKAVKAIERQELRNATLEERWQQLNRILGLENALGLSRGDDDSKMEVFQRWAKLKEMYETGIWSGKP